jgi:Flp pilus assembly protein TadG
MPSRRKSDNGQATVEVVLVMPVVVLLLMAALQVALVVRDQLAVVGAARDAARAASIGENPDNSVAAAGLTSARTALNATRHDGMVTVTIRYRAPTNVPLIGAFVGDIALHADATMRLEP